MTIFKCKMCGGDVAVSEEKTFGTCECCGSTMTFPKLSDEQKADAFNRGNHFRRIGEFDKALQVFERIVEEEPDNAEAHWCCALCRFGIEYVEDPATLEYIPTCHRASFDVFTDDVDYLAALECSDGLTRRQYQKDAAKIFEVQKGILATSQNEKPFDVFICYKETDENGNRTPDSIMAQDIYYQLTDEGLRVFFARITLEDKVGSEYEPYIFAALNSAKVMLAVGTKPEHFNAVWVKNEWSRYLAIVRHDRKKVLLPCYKDMDPYDLPEQLSVLQSYDMGKIGFIQDLIRGIGKIVNADTPRPEARETTPAAGGTNAAPLLERVFLFLEDGKWQDANIYCEKVLDIDPKNAEAYLGKLMAELQVRNRRQLADCAELFDGKDNYSKVLRFGNEAIGNELRGYIAKINDRNENNRLTGLYDNAVRTMKGADTEKTYQHAAELFGKTPGFQDADTLAEQCLEKAEVCRKERQEKEKADRLEAERRALEEQIAKAWAAKKRKRVIAVTTPIVVVCIAFVIVLITVIIPSGKYNSAMKLYNAGKYQDAYTAYNKVSYKDSKDKALECLFETQKENLSGIKKGATVKFGSYEQDNDVSNGKEEIEWIVLDVAENRALVISKYALDCQRYNSSYTDVIWEKCTLRKWLNDSFLNAAFGAKHQELIPSVSVSADRNPYCSTNPGNATTDKIFLLSITEASKYFAFSARHCSATAYAKAQGAYTNTENGNCWWWLRSPGYNRLFAAIINPYDSVYSYGYVVSSDDGYVRPAMWINIK